MIDNAKINELEREIERKEQHSVYLQEKLLHEQYYIDSLEKVLIDLTWKSNTK